MPGGRDFTMTTLVRPSTTCQPSPMDDSIVYRPDLIIDCIIAAGRRGNPSVFSVYQSLFNLWCVSMGRMCVFRSSQRISITCIYSFVWMAEYIRAFWRSPSMFTVVLLTLFPHPYRRRLTHSFKWVIHSRVVCFSEMGLSKKLLNALIESLLQLNQQQETTDHQCTLSFCLSLRLLQSASMRWGDKRGSIGGALLC